MKLLACATGFRGLGPRREARSRGQRRFIPMTARLTQLAVLCVAFAALALPAPAAADPDEVVRDCAADGSVDGDYSDADKRAALKRIPADLDEYSDCRSLIAASISGGRNGKEAGKIRDGGGAAASAATLRKKRAARKAAAAREKRAATEAAIGDRIVDPKAGSALETSSTDNGLSLPALLALISLALLLLAGSVMAIARRNGGLPNALSGLPAAFRRVSIARLRR